MNQSPRNVQVSYGSPRRNPFWAVLGLCCGIALIFFIAYGKVSAFGWGVVALVGAISLSRTVSDRFISTDAYAQSVTFGPPWVSPASTAWLWVCAAGPFLGYLITSPSLWTPSPSTWRGHYDARVFLSFVLPAGIALPLLVYFAFSAARWVAVPLVLFVTALPVATAWNCIRDLHGGDRWKLIKRDCYTDRSTFCVCDGQNVPCGDYGASQWKHVLYLPHTRTVLKTLGMPPVSVEEELKEEDLTYEVSAAGNYRVTLRFNDGRSQVAYVESKTKRDHDKDWRKVYSQAFSVTGDLSQQQADDLLADADTHLFGGWLSEQGKGKTRVYYQMTIPADAPAADLHHAISRVAGIADDMEKKVTDTDAN